MTPEQISGYEQAIAAIADGTWDDKLERLHSTVKLRKDQIRQARAARIMAIIEPEDEVVLVDDISPSPLSRARCRYVGPSSKLLRGRRAIDVIVIQSSGSLTNRMKFQGRPYIIAEDCVAEVLKKEKPATAA
jgi:hypothetical protein